MKGKIDSTKGKRELRRKEERKKVGEKKETVLVYTRSSSRKEGNAELDWLCKVTFLRATRRVDPLEGSQACDQEVRFGCEMRKRIARRRERTESERVNRRRNLLGWFNDLDVLSLKLRGTLIRGGIREKPFRCESLTVAQNEPTLKC